MTTAEVQTRQTSISRRKWAFQGIAYEALWIGVQAVFTTYDGERRIGTITHWQAGYPVVTFTDGTWARLDTHLEVVV